MSSDNQKTLRGIASFAHRLMIQTDVDDAIESLKWIARNREIPVELAELAGEAKAHGQAFRSALRDLKARAVTATGRDLAKEPD